MFDGCPNYPLETLCRLHFFEIQVIQQMYHCDAHALLNHMQKRSMNSSFEHLTSIIADSQKSRLLILLISETDISQITIIENVPWEKEHVTIIRSCSTRFRH